MELDDFLARLDQVHRHPRGISARCPVPEHDDHVNSLSVNAGKYGGIVVSCKVSCTTERVMESLGLTMADLMGLPCKVEEYYYTDMQGHLLYTVERWANPKTFRGYLPPPAERVLYNQRCIPWALANGWPVLWVEGEKDVNSCTARGIPSVTGCGGAGPGKILPQYVDALRGVDVIVVADGDGVGEEHAREKARLLDGVARSVQLTKSKVGNDISDALEAGYGLDKALEPLQTTAGVGSYLAAHIQPRKLEWAWKDHFALGKLGIVEGDPGDGKSIMTIDLAARWSTGMKMPDGTNGMRPCGVLMVSAEDDLEDTLIPRLTAAGADLRRVHLMTHGATPEEPFTFREGLVSVGRAVQQHDIKIVFFDPLMAFLGAETDSHNDASVRRALQPLKIMASNLRVAVILVRHLNKGGSGSKAIYRGGGSIGFTGAVRHTFLVTSSDDDTTRVLSSVKNNLAKKPASLTYTIEVGPQEVPYIRWGEQINLTAQEALDGPGRHRESEARDELRSKKKVRVLAGEFLLDFLSDGPKPWGEIVEAGRQDGHSARTLERARAEVGLTKVHGRDGNSDTRWARPEVPPDPPLRHFATQASTSPSTSLPGEVAKWEASEPDIPESDSDLDLDLKRDQDLAEAALVCDVCTTTINVNRYGKPHWLIRCLNHDPRYYGGGNEKESNSDGGGE